MFYGAIENIGTCNATLHSIIEAGEQYIKATDLDEVANQLIDWLEKQIGFESITAIGYRIVHGMQNTEPEIIFPELLQCLENISPYDPEHLPEEIKLACGNCYR